MSATLTALRERFTIAYGNNGNLRRFDGDAACAHIVMLERELAAVCKCNDLLRMERDFLRAQLDARPVTLS